MSEIANELKKKNMGAKMIVQVHDELVFDCPKDELDELIKLIRDIMENTYQLKVPLGVEIEYGDDWYQAK